MSVVLTVEGLVARRLELRWEDLAAIEPAGQIANLEPAQPKRSGDAIRLSYLLDKAGALPDATYLTLHASADDFHASVPLAAVREQGRLIYRREGNPLPVSSGGPIRFFIPDHTACHTSEIDECANVKFVDRLELTAEKGHDNRPIEERAHAALHARQSGHSSP